MKGMLAFGFVWLLLLMGCMSERVLKTERQSDYELFQSVSTGEHRSAVELRLGQPMLEEQQQVYYLSPPLISKAETPVAPGSIMIRYSDSGAVVGKKFYGEKVRERSK